MAWRQERKKNWLKKIVGRVYRRCVKLIKGDAEKAEEEQGADHGESL